MVAKLLTLAVIGVMVVFMLVPSIRDLGRRVLTSSEQITLPAETSEGSPEGGERSLELVTLLGFDAIPAILQPTFVTALEAEEWMDPDEDVLGLSINGSQRAYPTSMLSRHEIVNDVVGGVSVAVTW